MTFRKAPSEAQKQAGNYSKDHKRVLGMRVSIETRKGEYRKGKDHQGREWKQKMSHDYGYIRGAVGRDKDHLDVFMGPRDPQSHPVHVVDQLNHKGEFDEHKVVLGAANPQEASEVYHANYEPGWRGFGDVSALNHLDFKRWAFDQGRRIKPIAEHTVAKKPGYARGGSVFPLVPVFDPNAAPAGGNPVIHPSSGPQVGGFDVTQGVAPNTGLTSPFGQMVLPHPDLPSANPPAPPPESPPLNGGASAPLDAPGGASAGDSSGGGAGVGAAGTGAAAAAAAVSDALGVAEDPPEDAPPADAPPADDSPASDDGVGVGVGDSDGVGDGVGDSASAGDGSSGASGASGSGDSGGDGDGEKRGGLIRRPRYAEGGEVEQPAFVFPSMGKREFDPGSKHMAEYFMRGIVPGAAGFFGDVEGLGRAGINLMGGEVNEQPRLPSSESLQYHMPGHEPYTQEGALAQALGQFVGGSANPLNALRALRMLKGSFGPIPRSLMLRAGPAAAHASLEGEGYAMGGPVMAGGLGGGLYSGDIGQGALSEAANQMQQSGGGGGGGSQRKGPGLGSAAGAIIGNIAFPGIGGFVGGFLGSLFD